MRSTMVHRRSALNRLERLSLVLAFLTSLTSVVARAADPRTAQLGLRAGAAAINVSPRSFPVLINGGFLQNKATKVNDPLFARCLVLDDGSTRLAVVVVDSCMMPRELLDRAKEIARRKTGIQCRSYTDFCNSYAFRAGGHGNRWDVPPTRPTRLTCPNASPRESTAPRRTWHPARPAGVPSTMTVIPSAGGGSAGRTR